MHPSNQTVYFLSRPSDVLLDSCSLESAISLPEHCKGRKRIDLIDHNYALLLIHVQLPLALQSSEQE